MVVQREKNHKSSNGLQRTRELHHVSMLVVNKSTSHSATSGFRVAQPTLWNKQPCHCPVAAFFTKEKVCFWLCDLCVSGCYQRLVRLVETSSNMDFKEAALCPPAAVPAVGNPIGERPVLRQSQCLHIFPVTKAMGFIFTERSGLS